MALTENEQFAKILEGSKYLLILGNNKDSGDSLGSALALKAMAEKLRKQADVVFPGFTPPKNLKFLPGLTDIKPELAHLQKFIIKVDVSKTPVETLSYDIRDGFLYIYLTPKQGLLTKHELRTAQSTFKYDLIVTLGTPDLESLGEIFSSNSDLFYRTSVVNIDHAASNERYGQINLVDLTATSTSEVVYQLLKQTNESLIDAPMATALLTGMTIATKSFKSPNVTPVTLQLASQLINHGADREKIVQHLYRTRSVNTLRLWGQALTHLQTDPKLGLVWTTITREDFARSGASAEDLRGIIEELISNSPEAKIIILLFERPETMDEVHGLIATEKNNDAMELVKPLGPQGNKRQATFTLRKKSLKESEEEVLKLVKQIIGRENSL